MAVLGYGSVTISEKTYELRVQLALPGKEKGGGEACVGDGARGNRVCTACIVWWLTYSPIRRIRRGWLS